MNTGSISRQIPRLISKKDFKKKMSFLAAEGPCGWKTTTASPSSCAVVPGTCGLCLYMWSAFPEISVARCPPLDEPAMPRMQSHTRIMFLRSPPWAWQDQCILTKGVVRQPISYAQKETLSLKTQNDWVLLPKKHGVHPSPCSYGGSNWPLEQND